MLYLLVSLLAIGASQAPDVDLDTVVLPRKTDIFVTLERSLSTETAGKGDRFHARVSVPVTADDRIVVPVGSYIVGTINDAQKPGRLKGKGEMALAFDTVIFPNGVTRKIVAVTQSAEFNQSGEGADEGKIIASSSQADEIIDAASTTTPIGGAIGAARSGTLKGFGVGAALGAATGLILGIIQRGRHVVLPRGAALTIQLDQDARFVKPEPAPRGKTLKP